MKLAIIGGGGFRVPLIHQAIAAADAAVRVDELSLYDVSWTRLATICAILERQPVARPPRLTSTVDLAEALRGADFVFCAVRVGGTAGRIADERVALELGVLGQETVGAGGLSYALRTVPFMRQLAQTVRQVAPQAWVINFTNPAGIVTEAMQAVLSERVVGICDTPIGLLRRTVAAAGATEPSRFDYVGLNHLGWLREITVDGRNLLPEVLASDAALGQIEEARLLGNPWVRALGALPNEYLYYYYNTREAIARIGATAQTRGEFLDVQQSRFYAAPGEDPLQAWNQVRGERESTYMAESRPPEEGRQEADLAGGYQQVALDLMAALATGRRASMILNVRNHSLIPALPTDAVVEVGCTVDGSGIRPWPIAPVTGEMLGLITQVKAADQLAIAAAVQGSRTLAWRAFAAHPLVDSVGIAKQLVEGYASRFTEIGRLLA